MGKTIGISSLILAFLSSPAWGALECAIDLYKAPTSGQGGGAVIGGWAKGKSHPIYVTLKNAGIPYTTMTDRDGRWSIFFRLLSSRVTAEVWSPEAGEYSKCSD
jgi:hypothetical protein